MKNRRALITGANSGIGAATARVFAQAGFDLTLIVRSEDKLRALVSELMSLGIPAKVVAVDLSKIEQVRSSIEDVIADSEPIDVLVNCAGMGYTGSVAEMPLTSWQQVLNLNVTSVFQVIQAVLPGMRSQQNGTIVNIASIAANQSFENWGAYGVSKAAMVALSGAIAAEESGNGIRVVTISPCAVDTPLWDTPTVQANFDRSQMISADTVAQTILHTVSLPENAVISQLTITPSQGAL